MVGRTNVGGGGGSRNAYAIIVATYPEGSVCTCSDGTKTIRAKDTSGSFDFVVPYAATWTVSCTNGTKTASKDIVITSEFRFTTVTLLYELVIYDAGYVNPIAGSISPSATSGNGYYTVGSSNIRMHGSVGDSDVWSVGMLFTGAIDITPLQTLKMNYSLSNSCTHGSYFNVFGLTSKATAHNVIGNSGKNVDIARAEIPVGGSSASPALFSISVANINGSYRLANACDGYWGTTNLYIYRIWFE